MPSGINVSDHSIIGNPDFRPTTCIFCSFILCWKHGSYVRKGTYYEELKIPPEEEKIQRYLCKRAGCGRTFSVLPSDTLPYCRFKFRDFLCIHDQYQKGATAYSIWKSCRLQQVCLSAVKCLCTLIRKVMLFVQNWCREIDEPVSNDLKSMCFTLLERNSWFGFTSRWYHAFYPNRLWQK